MLMDADKGNFWRLDKHILQEFLFYQYLEINLKIKFFYY